MKAALQAKRQYLMATAAADGSVPAAAAASAATGGGAASRAGGPDSAKAAGGAAGGKAAAGAEGWESDESGSVTRSVAEGDAVGTPFDAAGPLPAGWTAHKDAEGDTWYFNAATQVSSWTRPT